MKKILPTLLAAGLLASPMANAAFIFSDIQVASNSVTFTIDGDMSGYATPGQDFGFTLIYDGDLWTGPTSGPDSFTANSWSNDVFDNHTLTIEGNTGWFDGASDTYSWSHYDGNLSDAVASLITVTLDLGGNWLDPLATGTLSFAWGNGFSPDLHTILFSTETWNEPSTSVPEPGSLALLGLGLVGLGFGACRRRA